MSTQTTEKAFETYVEEMLLSDEIGWQPEPVAGWDKKIAIFPERVCSFLAETQKEAWEKLEKHHGDQLESELIRTLAKELDLKGTLHVLRHGFKFFGQTLKMANFAPANRINESYLALFKKNRLGVTRQVPCHPDRNDTVDMLFSLNGIPVATVELKNPNTRQNYQNAIKQYREDRDPNAPLFRFKKRALVHFAADPNEIWMATKLAKQKTYFLPFNRGSDPQSIECGAGNPLHPSGYRTGYFWQNVLQRDQFLDILARFMFVEKVEEKVLDDKGRWKKVEKETMIFPRYHQWEAVRLLEGMSRDEGPGNNYLVQHSAGSGKTNSISWLAHRLASIHNEKDEAIFDTVLIITDRVVLDRQLQDAVYQIEHKRGLVQGITKGGKQLANALVDQTKILIGTLQTFPFVLRGLLYVAGAKNADQADPKEMRQAIQYARAFKDRRYAIIVDEAHSSQTGEMAREIKGILGAAGHEWQDGDDEPTWEDTMTAVMESRGKQPNMSFFAFTATPKGKTLEIFGRKGQSGGPEATHKYSMKQAIEERFILDVLRKYIHYKTYFRLVKSVKDDPNLPKKAASKAVGKFVNLHEVNVSQKTELIIEHFREHVMHQLKGKAKAMVVTDSRLSAVRYKLAFDKYIKENKYTDEVRTLVAFSGTVKDEDVIDPVSGNAKEYTEPGMNTDIVTGKSIGEGELPEKFAGPHYQILLVANKYQTGFDQPLLCAMYVDKRLDGVQAVQTLSRLNRMIPGKEAPFVLDFRNEPEDIKKAFKPYYNSTTLQEQSDPEQLERLKHELEEFQILDWDEINAFAAIFYKQLQQQTPKDHAKIEQHVQPTVDRFNKLEIEEKKDFKDKLGGFIRVYAFLSQVLPYTDPEHEKLYSFGRQLDPNLNLEDKRDHVYISDEVGLEMLRHQKQFEGIIAMEDSPDYGVKSPTDVGTRKAEDEKVPLSQVITALNDRFGTEFTEEDRLFFEQVKEHAVNNPDIRDMAKANPEDRFILGLEKMIEKMMTARHGKNEDIVDRYLQDEEFKKIAYPLLAAVIYQAIRADTTL